MTYSYSTEVSLSHGFEKVEEELENTLADHGFGILTEIDVKATMKAKLNIDKRPYKILGACNPPRANKAIDGEGDIGILLPCNVVIYETEHGNIRIAATKASSIFTVVENPDVAPIAKEVDEIFAKVIAEVKLKFNN